MKSRKTVSLWMCILALCLTDVAAKKNLIYPDYLPTEIGQYTPGPAIDIHKNLSDQEWPQLGNTPQRTNFSPMKFDPPQGRLKWVAFLTDFDIDNKIAPVAQVIVAEGLCFIGTKNGRMFALDAKSGEVKWTFQAGGPILHTAGCASGRLLFLCMDGKAYALNARDGTPLWTFDSRRRHGFSTAILLAEDKAFAVDRGGRLFALDAASGAELWHYDAGAPVDHSPAWNAGKVFFASEDLRVHAVNAADGSRAWRTEPLGGMSFRWTHPVVVSERVFVEAMGLGKHLEDFRDPARRVFFALDEKTGKELPPLPRWLMGHDGPQPPPAVTRDGKLVVQWSCPDFMKMTIHNSYLGWAVQDPDSGQILMPLIEDKPGPMQSHGEDYLMYYGTCAADENLIASVLGDLALVIHHQGFRQGPTPFMTGAFDFKTRRWSVKGGKGSKGDGWHYHSQPPNHQCGGSNAVSGAGGLLYHADGQSNRIVCHEPEPLESATSQRQGGE
mgnify:CR=1 FL=1